MMGRNTIRRGLRAAATAGIALSVAVSVGAGAARALPPCPTFFPDFRCERHGRYDGFVPPMMHPYLFEDPFITTGLSAWGIWHQFPDSSILDGGQLWVAALQARVAITDRIAFIATKDGLARFMPNLDLLKHSQTGFTDMTFGLKGSLLDKPELPFILSPSLRLQVPVGDKDVLQGNGNTVFIPDVSAAWSAKTFGLDKLHLISDFGGQFPTNTNSQSTSLFYHLHLDYALFPLFVPFVEIGGFHYLDGGDGSTRIKLANGAKVPLGTAQALLGTSPEEGYDYANLGSRGVANSNVVAWSVGFRVPINQHLDFGAAYERPVTENKDVLRQRVSLNMTLEY